ncbi:hypothetical protein [Nannocystis punicea]|uniref:Uncharacterized protein n=1 Tax=Nannocystis punicea TaxID=2995304 RepID=A0ABY7HCI9_9BACT|nr:hypothetical protein [Nannocystis poenicansa]WAS96714.1 hypothetical protein O0S08_11235 [Nannocystis poenicansa]
MRNKFFTIASALSLAGVIGTSVALAASVHFKGGKNAGPSFQDLGVTLEARGTLAGLGNEDLLITLEATGDPTATCTNPAGSTQPPGQNPAEVTLTGVQSIPASAIKNGNVSFDVTTAQPVSPIPGAPDCPNTKWTERILDISFTSAKITVEQPAGTIVLTANCTFDDGIATCTD